MRKPDLIDRYILADLVDANGNVHWADIAELPSEQPEQQWIPCSERLPKPYEYCLWTTTDGRVIYHHCDGLFSNYTAWMPLPKPYAERRTDGHEREN